MKRPYLLDTNIVSRLMQGHALVSARVDAVPLIRIGMSVISELELRYGLEKKGRTERLSEQLAEAILAVPVKPLPPDLAKHYAPLRVELERRGTPLSAHDVIIAAHAVAAGAVLVTNNTREFERVKGLRVEDWSR